MPIELPVREPCPFCRNLRSEVLSDEPRTKRLSYVDRDANVAAVVNPYQVSHGAVLVMPSRHAPAVLDLTEGEAESLARLIRRVAIAVHDALGPVGLNIYQNNGVAGGQSIPHYHVHVVPRYPGDRPGLLLGTNAVLISFDERVALADRITGYLPWSGAS